MDVRLAVALVPAGRLDAEDRDGDPAGFGRHDEVGPQRAVLAAALDDVSCLNEEIEVAGVLDEELVDIPGLADEPSCFSMASSRTV